jgi:hypothetical protein
MPDSSMILRPSTDKLLGDEPKNSIAADEFGLAKLVEGLASTLTERVQAESYVLGIDGVWGSGKSSIANFLAEALIKCANHRVVRFEPWLIGDRESLILHFFAQINLALDTSYESLSLDSASSRVLKKTVKALRNNLVRYGEYASVLSASASAASSADPFGIALLVATGTGVFAKVTKALDRPISLPRLKAEITGQLKRIDALSSGFRVTVIIDDIDRLEPSEAVEILRLVRKVADFPLISYVLCFDRTILAKQINRVSATREGNEYIDKIVQNIITVPPQEPFALRRYMQRLLADAFPNDMARGDPTSIEYGVRKEVLFDTWGGLLLKTPRDVVRVCEAVKLGWPHAAIRADFLDYVWLQMIKVKARELYDWTREYVSELGGFRDSGRPSDGASLREAERLKSIMSRLGWREGALHHGLDYFLPGIGAFVLEDKAQVFQIDMSVLEKLERGRRLGSPSHWRGYFTFEQPSYAVTDDEIATFMAAAGDNYLESSKLFRGLLRREHPKPGHYADVLVDRLAGMPLTSMSAMQREGIVSTFSHVMDDAIRIIGLGFGGDRQVWRRSEKILTSDIAQHFLSLLPNTASVNWFAYAIRQQGSAHGRPGGTPRESSDLWLTPSELDIAIERVIARLTALGSEVFRLPVPLDALNCWLELADATKLRAFIANHTKTDTSFLDALDAMRVWHNSSDTGVYFPLYRKVVGQFMDIDVAMDRLHQLMSEGDLVERARGIKQMWRDSGFGPSD